MLAACFTKVLEPLLRLSCPYFCTVHTACHHNAGGVTVLAAVHRPYSAGTVRCNRAALIVVSSQHVLDRQ